MSQGDLTEFFRKTFRTNAHPQLSFRDIEQAIASKRGHHRQASDPRLTNYHRSQMNLSSPFYDRGKACKKINCHCPYHLKLIEERRLLRSESKLKSRQAHRSLHACRQHQTESQQKRSEMASCQSVLSRNSIKRPTVSNHLLQGSRNQVDSETIKNLNRNSVAKVDTGNLLVSKKIKRNRLSSIHLNKSQKELLRKQALFRNSVRQLEPGMIESVTSKITPTNPKDSVLKDSDQKTKQSRAKRNKKVGFQTDIEIFKSDLPKVKTKQGNSKSMQRKSNRKSVTKPQPQPKRLKKSTSISKKLETLLIKTIINKLEMGEEVTGADLRNFEELTPRRLNENCEYLLNNIELIDIKVFERIRKDLLQNILRRNSSSGEVHDKFSKLQRILEKMVWMIRERGKIKRRHKFKKETKIEIESHAQVEQEAQQDHSIEVENKFDWMMVTKQSQPSFAPTKTHTEVQAQTQEQQQELVENMETRFFNLQETQFQQLPESQDEQQQQIKSELRETVQQLPIPTIVERKHNNRKRLRLATFRRLSEQSFCLKKVNKKLDWDDNVQKERLDPMIARNLKKQLANMAEEISQKMALLQIKLKYLNELTGSLKNTRLGHLIASPGDSLLTVRRKFRVLQQFLKPPCVLDSSLKCHIQQYITCLREAKFLENRRWMEPQLQRKIMTQVQSRDLLTQDERQQEEAKSVGKVLSACRLHRLTYITLKATKYEDDDMEAKYISLTNEGLQNMITRSSEIIKAPTLEYFHMRNQNDGALGQKGLNCVSKCSYVRDQ